MKSLDTAQSEGETNMNQNMSVTEWLQLNKLRKLIDYVEENELTLENFLTYNEEDMELNYTI